MSEGWNRSSRRVVDASRGVLKAGSDLAMVGKCEAPFVTLQRTWCLIEDLSGRRVNDELWRRVMGRDGAA